MAQRSRRRPRCLGCGLTPETCLCAALPRLRLATPMAIVQHNRERFKPTSTGRLLARMVEGAAVLPFGIRGVPFDPGPLLDPSIEWLLLFPREGAPEFDPRRRPTDGRRLGLVLLDGTWSQCARMSHRVPGISRLPCLALPAGGPSIWTVRTQHDERGRSTFEAALQGLQLLGDSGAAAVLREAFAQITAMMLHLKGKLRSPEIPAAWRV